MNVTPISIASLTLPFLIPKKPELISDIVNLLVPETAGETTETSSWNLVRSKMKLFTKEINSLEAITHVHKENACIF